MKMLACRNMVGSHARAHIIELFFQLLDFVPVFLFASFKPIKLLLQRLNFFFLVLTQSAIMSDFGRSICFAAP